MATGNITLTQVRKKHEAQRAFFASGASKELKTRTAALEALKASIKRHEDALLQALTTDLGKSGFEGYATEIGLVYKEIEYALDHVEDWMKPAKGKGGLPLYPSKGRVYPEPKGIVLVMSPWNYPFFLTFAPLVNALTAGNCVTLKASQSSPATSAVMARIIDETFYEQYVTFYPGGGKINEHLLKIHYDHICFTGSANVGRKVMAAAAPFLTPVTLELGGKSPCIVDVGADLKISAERIIWGKLTNAGQTCVAPDYILVHQSVRELLISNLKQYIKEFYGDSPLENPNYPHIINEKHFDRLVGLLNVSETASEIVYGGHYDEDTRKIEPTLVDWTKPSDPLMQEEIFGPILPIITYKDLDEAIAFVNSREHPLALYLFTRENDVKERIINEVTFGGGAINDTLVHLATSTLPFGGIGESGMGHYHGKWGFDTFTHYKTVLDRGLHPNIKIRNMPPAKSKENIIRFLLK